ncbi:MAG: transposase [Psychrobium sp.]|nr:transposase [Psychrobium sp.]
MQLVLIANITDPERHAIVIMDGASWHNEDISADFPNVSMIKLPPYSPELNPIEQVWSWMRQHHLANRSFKGYDDIVSSICEAWNSFLNSAERVTSMCTRDWINLAS